MQIKGLAHKMHKKNVNINLLNNERKAKNPKVGVCPPKHNLRSPVLWRSGFLSARREVLASQIKPRVSWLV